MPKILIVEDEVDAAMLLGKRLSKTGFEVLTANDVPESIELLQKEKVDLVILDLMLPAGGGVIVLKSIRGDARTSGIPVVVLTASHSPGYKQKVLEEGVQAYLEKPYDPAELIATIKKLLC